MSSSKIVSVLTVGGLVLVGAASCRKAESAGDAAKSAPASGAANTAAPASAPASSPAGTPGKAAAPAVPDAVKKLLGKWLRADGGYVLELKSADISGVVDAAYFNPKPIHVSRAVWMQGPAGLQVAVELNDVGYPGATYLLTHDAQGDRLVGQYTQPQMQQTFDIEFVRQPNP